MKNLFKLLVIVTIFSACSKDEPELTSKELICASERYATPIFNEVKVTLDVQYGSNLNTLNVKQDLFMDVYEPKGDTLSQRPAIVFAFGGSFLAGDRLQLSELATEVAKLGYVGVCIDYRLLSFLQLPIDSVKGLDIAIKASGDMKAAIRHLRKDAATANVFRIDPNFIIAAGLSAGAITAMQATYFDSEDNTDPYIKSVIDNNGGVEGNSGDAENLTYSSKVQGVINMSGAVYRPEFIDAGEAPLISFHGDNDATVAYGYDYVYVFSQPIIPLYGSFEIDKRAKAVGVSSVLYTVPGGGHDDIYTQSQFQEQYTAFRNAAYIFTKEIICQ